MRIENLRKIKENNIEKAVATVIFEDNDRAPADVYFHTSEEYNHFIGLNPDAFVLAAYTSAMFSGEKRIYIEGKIDENLKKGLLLNMKCFQRWYGRKYKVIPIESSNIGISQMNNPNRNTGAFFSGGIDSIYTLQNNRLKYSPDHPLHIKDCFIIHGFDMYWSSQHNKDIHIFERAVKRARLITEETGTNLIPVFTNLRHHFYGDRGFWGSWHHGAALAAVSHCFTSRVKSIFIASSFSPSMIEPWGTHPLIDPNHSSSYLKVIHDDLCSTIEKLELISTWETAFQNIRSCYQNDETLLNCCHCEKCVRIMITLMALGILDKSHAFPIHHISPELLRNAIREHRIERFFRGSYLQLVPFLKKHGYIDMANIVLQENKLKSKLRRLDQRYFHGKLKKLINILR